MARASDSDRMRERRQLFERAMRDGVTLEEARRRVAAERWAITDSRLASKVATPCAEDDRQAGFWWRR